MKKIAFLTVATGKYVQFLPRLKETTEEFWGYNHFFHIGSDKPLEGEADDDFASSFVWPHLPWPLSTMLRCHAYLTVSEYLLKHYDYVFAIDADMVWRAPVNVEELCQPLIACAHPGFEGQDRASFPYENNPQSSCCVKQSEGSTYFAGGFFGGRTDCFITVCAAVACSINQDLNNHIIPRWHDESSLNRALIDFPPTEILRGFMVPEEQVTGTTKAPLVALQKKHEEIRG
jgi:hypothetical protein